MRLTIEGSAEELRAKRDQLLKALVHEFETLDPELAEIFQKAVPRREPQLKYKVLRQLHEQSKKGYSAQLQKMIDDVMAVLEIEPVRGQKPKRQPIERLRKVQKADFPESEDRDPGEEPPDPDYDEESGEPIIDPETGMSPTEMKEAKEQGLLEEDEEADEEAEKGFSLWPSGRMPIVMCHSEDCCGASSNYQACDCGTVEREQTALSKARKATPVGGTTPGGYTVKLVGGKRVYVKELKSGAKLEYPEKVLLKDGRVAKLVPSSRDILGEYRVYDKGRFTGYVTTWLSMQSEIAPESQMSLREVQSRPKRQPVPKTPEIDPHTKEANAKAAANLEEAPKAIRAVLKNLNALEAQGKNPRKELTPRQAITVHEWLKDNGAEQPDNVHLVWTSPAGQITWRYEKLTGKYSLQYTSQIPEATQMPPATLETQTGDLTAEATGQMPLFSGQEQHKPKQPPKYDNPPPKDEAEAVTREAADSGLRDGLEVEGFAMAGSPAAFELFGPHESMQCTRCGANIANVFATSKGPMGGDCLATLTGDDSTRRVVKKIHEKLTRVKSWRSVQKIVAFEIKPAMGTRSGYWLSVRYRTPESRVEEYSGELTGLKSELIGTIPPNQLNMVAGMAEQMAEEESAEFTLQKSEQPPKRYPIPSQPDEAQEHSSDAQNWPVSLFESEPIPNTISSPTQPTDGDNVEKSGPFIGPRGGKWKDAAHTIPWEESKQKYQYGMHFRPAGMGATPKGHTGVQKHPAFRHGVIEYDRPLTPEEIKSYELAPILSPKQIEARIEATLAEFEEYAEGWREMAEEEPRGFDQTVRQELERQGPGYAGDIDALVAEVRKRFLKKGLAKAGPFIGPRGGKWKDAAHTIPWEEPTAPTKEKQLKVSVHPAIDGRGGHSETFRVVSQTNDTVKLSRHEGSDWGPTMPKESVKHFVNDLQGKVDLPPSGRADIDAVLSGKAKLLGKGDDGLAFKAGKLVVKVSTTVPFQPENPGHRTPQQASDMLKKQVETGNLLADKGIKGVQRSEFVQHGDKGFQIKPFVEIPERLTREQLNQIQETVHQIHEAGYAIRDTIQAGLDAKGEPVMFDVGKAAPKSDATGIHSDEASDIDSLKMLYRDHGETFVNTRQSEAQTMWDLAMDMRLREKRPDAKFVNHMFQRAADKLKAEAQATLSGKELTERLEDIDSDLEFFRIDEPTEKAEGLADPLEHDHTKQIADKEAKTYSDIQRELIKRGAAKPSDFEIDGPLYGRSNNELISWLESLKANNGGE